MPEEIKKEQETAELEGEIIIVPSKKGVDPDFFKAMMAFQYGEREESDAGFEKMKKLAQPSKEEEK